MWFMKGAIFQLHWLSFYSGSPYRSILVGSSISITIFDLLLLPQLTFTSSRAKTNLTKQTKKMLNNSTLRKFGCWQREETQLFSELHSSGKLLKHQSTCIQVTQSWTLHVWFFPDLCSCSLSFMIFSQNIWLRVDDDTRSFEFSYFLQTNSSYSTSFTAHTIYATKEG